MELNLFNSFHINYKQTIPKQDNQNSSLNFYNTLIGRKQKRANTKNYINSNIEFSESYVKGNNKRAKIEKFTIKPKPFFNTNGSEDYEDPNNLRCNCENSKCQKNYCVCFSEGIGCNSKCSCLNCLNKTSITKEKKVKEICCTCRTTFCLKKYCECLKANQECSSNCKCFECKNHIKSKIF